MVNSLLTFYKTSDLTLERMSFLFHGEYGAGKTEQMGQILMAYMPDCLAVNFGGEKSVAGEDGLLTLKAKGLPAVDVGDWAQWQELLQSILTGKLKLRAVGLDGAPAMYKTFMRSITQAEAPEPSDYQKSHPRFENQLTLLRRAVPLLVLTTRSDRSMDQVRQEIWTTPDLPGRMATQVASYFDFVFYLEHDVQMGKLIYRLHTARAKTVTRARLPRALPPVINDPSWSRIRAEIEAAVEGKPSPLATAGPAFKPTVVAGR